ncbi:hypothetical protein [Anaerobaca lacustris]|uniref:Uncharacterized protein n=1 Tax=Anaerobaca lacustris TaxID=3044600 RepID=A0AAW6TW07_9BACT|nr:hypothetical protein [Sedimentisphaerales bacterium M17dextr]
MAETAPIDTNVLKSGDMIDLEYQIVGSNETMIALAVKAIKDTVHSDPRLDYQSGWREYRWEWSGGSVGSGSLVRVEYLIVQAIVRRYPRGEPEPEREIQEAGIWIPLTLIVAMLAAAVAAYPAAIIYRSYVIHRTVKDPGIPEETKVAALGAYEKTGSVDVQIPGVASLGDWVPWLLAAGLVGAMVMTGRSRRE